MRENTTPSMNYTVTFVPGSTRCSSALCLFLLKIQIGSSKRITLYIHVHIYGCSVQFNNMAAIFTSKSRNGHYNMNNFADIRFIFTLKNAFSHKNELNICKFVHFMAISRFQCENGDHLVKLNGTAI